MKNTVEKYLNEELSPQEEEQLEQLLLDSLWRHQAKQHYQEALAKQGINRDKAGKVKKLRTWRKPLLIAASILALMAFAWTNWMLKPTAQQYVVGYLAQNYFDNASFRKSADPENQISAFDEAYDLQKYKLSQTLGKNIIATGQRDNRILFFVGLSFLYDDEPEEAISYFEQVLNQPASFNTWKEESRWFIALSYIQQGQEITASKYLKEIEAGDWNYKAAQELISLID